MDGGSQLPALALALLTARPRARLGAHSQLLGRRGDIVHGVPVIPRAVLRHATQHSVWESMPTAALFAAAAVTVSLMWFWWAPRHGFRPRYRRVLHTLVAAGAVVSMLLGLAVGVNAYAGYAPSWGALWGKASAAPLRVPTQRSDVPAVNADSSTVVSMRVADAGGDIGGRTAYVYLPPGYFDEANEHARYPVVYLLHGIPGYAADWLLAGNLRRTMDVLLRAQQIQPMIVVMPQINSGFFDDSECLNFPGGEQDETYLTDTIVADVDASFRTLQTRTARAIGGMSAGGFCALNLGLRHLDEFSVILSSEPYSDPGMSLVRRLHSWTLWRQNAPRDYLPTMPLTHTVAVFLDAGSRDRHTLPTARWLAAEFAARGQYVALRVAPHQAHTWTAARLELPYSLVFANAHLQHATGLGSVTA